MSMLVGCSALEDRPATTALLLSYSTQRMIDSSNDPFGRAERTVAVVDKFLQYVDSGDLDGEVTINDLLSIGRTFIDWDGMLPSDQIIVNALLDAIAEDFARKLEQKVVSESDMIHIHTALNVVRNTAVAMSTKAE